jgi:hypothetical protein
LMKAALAGIATAPAAAKFGRGRINPVRQNDQNGRGWPAKPSRRGRRARAQ